MDQDQPRLTRRRLLQLGVALPLPIVPGLYPGRTRHIHVKVQAPDRPVLTTQLYFPGEPANASDGIFREELLLDMCGDRQGSFTFVLEV
jgi:hypothetical protein